ncbi:MAG: hypothetical protein QF729_01010 [Candidatus Woesearchaeota archaeon]|jgi:SOS response regulatory protein OraA/RecX|nr:hypothetical protein [Candidatus Woesearchaeota archaeon]
MPSEPLPLAMKLVQTLKDEGLNDKSIETVLKGTCLPIDLQHRVEILFKLKSEAPSHNKQPAQHKEQLYQGQLEPSPYQQQLAYPLHPHP